jgi:hypothetical protein
MEHVDVDVLEDAGDEEELPVYEMRRRRCGTPLRRAAALRGVGCPRGSGTLPLLLPWTWCWRGGGSPPP